MWTLFQQDVFLKLPSVCLLTNNVWKHSDNILRVSAMKFKFKFNHLDILII